jgi:DNA-directed RNA polymerase subunit RPC12/RpoP
MTTTLPPAQASDEPIRKATVIYSRPEYVECPYCEERVDGWLGNPQGQETTCDDCGRTFQVHPDADVELEP